MWQHGEIPTDIVQTILFLILKGNTDTWGIGLLDTLWKVVEAIIDTRLREIISFHDIIHGFHVERGMGTAILELRLAQEMASVDQDPVLLVYLDLRKAYETVYRGSVLTTPKGYSAGPYMRGHLVEF